MFGVFKKLLQEAVVRNLDLKQLVQKLKVIVLTSAPLAEISPRLNDTFELLRRRTRGTITAAEIENFVARHGDRDPWEDVRLMWEPLSDGLGEEITPNGWQVRATLYLLNGQPWWLADAIRDPNAPPTPEDDAVLDSIMEQLGADTQRDLVRNMRDLPELGYQRIWTWFHTGPLLETHRNETTGAICAAPEGSQPKAGYTCEPRLTWAVIEGLRERRA